MESWKANRLCTKRHFSMKAFCPSLGRSAFWLFVLMTALMKPGLSGSTWFLPLIPAEPWFGCWRFEANGNEKWAVEVGRCQLSGQIKAARRRTSKCSSASTEQSGMEEAGDHLSGAEHRADWCQGTTRWGSVIPKRPAESYSWPWNSVCAMNRLHFLPYYLTDFSPFWASPSQTWWYPTTLLSPSISSELTLKRRFLWDGCCHTLHSAMTSVSLMRLHTSINPSQAFSAVWDMWSSEKARSSPLQSTRLSFTHLMLSFMSHGRLVLLWAVTCHKYTHGLVQL